MATKPGPADTETIADPGGQGLSLGSSDDGSGGLGRACHHPKHSGLKRCLLGGLGSSRGLGWTHLYIYHHLCVCGTWSCVSQSHWFGKALAGTSGVTWLSSTSNLPWSSPKMASQSWQRDMRWNEDRLLRGFS